MILNAKRNTRFLYLLVGALLLVASGALAATHDHGPDECCRICSSGERIETPIAEARTETPRLEASTAPTLTAAADTGIGVLLATPLRGPPRA